MELKKGEAYGCGNNPGRGNTDLGIQLESALDYAACTGSFHKMNLIDRADAVCVFGLGTYFEDAFFKQNVKERFHVSLLCDNSEKRLKEVEETLGADSGLRCIAPDHLPKYGNVAVILMLGDTRDAVRQLSKIVGPTN